jgi:phosphate-selective porin OprO/OprP
MLAATTFWCAGTIAGGQEAAMVPAATEQNPVAPPPPRGDVLNLDDVRARFEQQQQEINRLQAQLAGFSQQPITPVAANSAQGAPVPKPGDDPKNPPQPYQVGSDLNVQASLHDGLFLWLNTPNKDFTMHLGAWMQLDSVWWNQSPALRAAPGQRPGSGQGVATGVATGGINELEDGIYFRRIRPFAEGTFWDTGEYRLILALENNQFNSSGLDEFWVGETNLPVAGTVRIGHVKTPMGLEGDMTASSRCMTFMERSSYSEAIELNQNFVTGVWLSNNYFEQRATWEFAAFYPDQKASSGVFFGNGQSGVQGRLTGLPIYEDEGRHLLHLGMSAGWRAGTANGANGYTGNTMELSARPEMRDDDPAGGGPGVIPNADSYRMVDTGVIASRNEYLMGLESLYIRGPFSVQAEYGWNWIDNATGVVQSSSAALTPFATPQNFMFNGGYIQLAYTLTGENRAYDKRIGTLAREYFGKPGPHENFWLVRDDNGSLFWGRGAWEIAARYSYLDLNSGTGTNRIQGGIMDGVSLGLNWYLNTNLNVMFDWAYDNRYDLPTGTTAGAASTIPGYTSGFGMRVQFQF